jgi:Xaa-Pro aminopeptidase
LAAKSLPPPLLYADTERSPDALYFGRVGVPDAFVAFGLRGKKYAVVSALEFGRVQKTSAFDVVLPLMAAAGLSSFINPPPQPAPPAAVSQATPLK